jgi:hypothetical protein
MLICGEKYHYDNLHPTLYNAFRKGYEKFKNETQQTLEQH